MDNNRPPESLAQYVARFEANHRISGYGAEVKTHIPCPFCAAADFMALPILDVEGAMSKGAICRECGRSARAIFTKTPNQITFEVVQVDGPDQPAWLVPKIRRVQ